MVRLYLYIVSYSLRARLEPNRATSCSSYWAMLLFMTSLQEPRRRSNVCASITAETQTRTVTAVRFTGISLFSVNKMY